MRLSPGAGAGASRDRSSLSFTAAETFSGASVVQLGIASTATEACGDAHQLGRVIMIKLPKSLFVACGQSSLVEVRDFLSEGHGPQHEALLRLLENVEGP